METSKDIIINSCTAVQAEHIITSISPEGSLIHIQVHLEEVCPYNYMMVGVIVFAYAHPYAFQSKEIYTGPPNCDDRLLDMIVDDFYFIFPEYVCPDDLDIKVVTHYINQ